ncbi:MAG: hypothetical protein ACLFP1_08140 [Candidatus Goldiibacteriota bacterium]
MVKRISFFIGLFLVTGAVYAELFDKEKTFIETGEVEEQESSGQLMGGGAVVAPPTKTFTPEPSPTATFTPVPTVKPTIKPTEKPTVKPTAKPTKKPTAKPTKKPAARPALKPTPKPAARKRPTPVRTPEFEIVEVTYSEVYPKRTAENFFGLIGFLSGEKNLNLSVVVKNTGKEASYYSAAELVSPDEKIAISNARHELKTILPDDKRQLLFKIIRQSGYSGPEEAVFKLKLSGSGVEKTYPLALYIDRFNPYFVYGIIGGGFLLLILLIIILSRGGKKQKKKKDKDGDDNTGGFDPD